jgi:hypothetical protein
MKGATVALKTERMLLVMTPDEKIHLAELARREGRSMSGLIRWAIARYEVQNDEGNAR